ncbi:hypothetical protein ACHAXA_000001 [Cyclostephanos tholiformis]|uniref:Uncharacterized protein n=1 Tax=Cyclostephanos tholiformis TaxID=382380 RepID=A0ABD3RSL1_9STRA
MSRLVPFLVTATMAFFPLKSLQVLIGKLFSVSGPLSYSSHYGVCLEGTSDVIAPSLKFRAFVDTEGRGSGFVPGVAHAVQTAAHHSHFSMVAATASIASSAMGGSGGQNSFLKSVSAELLESGSRGDSNGSGERRNIPRQLQPMPEQGEQQQVRQASNQDGKVTASALGAGRENLVAEAPPDTLKVSVLGATRGKSSTCAHSLVEFSNTNHVDTIIVYSTYIEPTAVFPSKWASDRSASLKSDITLSSSPLFHGEYYQDKQMQIPPRTAVTIPVSIIPHWREPLDSAFSNHHYRKLNATQSSPTDNSSSSNYRKDEHLSALSSIGSVFNSTKSAIRADLLDMIAHSKRGFPSRQASSDRARLLDDASIYETLVANTSWGLVQMKVPYVCSPQSSKEYEFGLPNNLMFLDDGGGWYARRNTTPTVELAYLFGDWEFNPTRDAFDPFIYRVYMNNPTARELRVWEVYTTKPHLVDVELQLHFDSLSTWRSSSNSVNGVEYYYPFQGHVHHPKKNNIYVATLRLFPQNFTVEMRSSIQDLGFLRIRTNVGSFATALDFIPNSGRGGVIHGAASENHVALGGLHLVQEHIMDGLLSSSEIDLNTKTPFMSIAKSYRAESFDSTLTASDYIDREKNVHLQNCITGDLSSFITVTPEKINFGSITTGSRTKRILVKLTNHHNISLSIMRISVAINVFPDPGDGNLTNISSEGHKIEVGVDFLDGSPIMLSGNRDDNIEKNDGVDGSTPRKQSFVFSREWILPPDTDFDFPLTVWCRLIPYPGETKHAQFYSGSILIRTSEANGIPYFDWERQFLIDSTLGGGQSSPQYLLDIPFEGSILPGNIGSPTESLIFPTRFLALPVDQRVKIIQENNGEIPHFFDRYLDISNNFAVPISIVGLRVLGSSNGGHDFCKSRFMFDEEAVGLYVDGHLPSTAASGKKWKGILIRYQFLNDDDFGGFMVKKCTLSLQTDRAGKQSLPLIMYSGELVVQIERPDHEGEVSVNCMVTKKDGSRIVARSGMPCMNDWMRAFPEGNILQKAILKNQLSAVARQQNSKGKNRKSSHNCTTAIRSDPVESYFRSLLPSTTSDCNKPLHEFQPIVMSFGAINTGETMTLSMVLTNLNHLPIEILATSAALEYMNVSIGLVPILLQEKFEAMMNFSGKEDLASFHASSMGKEFFSELVYKSDISPSPHAIGTELSALFQRQVVIDTFQNSSDYLSNYIDIEEKDMDCAYGFMLSTDGTYEKTLYTRKVGKKKWTIPAGGVVRFEVTVTAPMQSELKNDVTAFVGTGLVLQSSHGQALPIIVKFSAIGGRLKLKPLYDSKATDAVKENYGGGTGELMVQVPMIFADPTLSPAVDLFLEPHGISLSIESTFLHDIYLSQIRSCNKWFHVFLGSNDAGKRVLQIKGVGTDILSYEKTIIPLGKILAALSCSHPSSDTSFFACALAWLENRDQIQPRGCGLTEEYVSSRWMSLPSKVGKRRISHEMRIRSAKMNAVASLRDVVAILSVRYADETSGKNVVESKEGYSHFSRIHTFKHARKMWKEIALLGLNEITGHINAKTVYTTDRDLIRRFSDQSNNISSDKLGANTFTHREPSLAIPVSSVLLQSKLEIPRLFWGVEDYEDSIGVVDFGTIHVADTATRTVPIVNPTAMTLRVRLTAIDRIDGSFGNEGLLQKNIYVQTPDEHHSWWTGGSYWMSDDEGHLISASHNVTIKSGAGAFVCLLNPALHTMTAFVLGCGRRCGLRNDQDPNGEEKNYSPIGAGSGDGSTLLGRSYMDIPQENKTPKKALDFSQPPPFSLVRFSQDIVLEPYGVAELGPVHFRPPSQGDFEGTMYIENSLTGFEELKIRGRGGWENLVFLDQLPGHIGDIEFRFGKPTLVFPGSYFQSVENNMDPVVKSVRLSNHGKIPVDISQVYMTSSEVMHFTHRRRHPLPSFVTESSAESRTRHCFARGFVLLGCVDSFSSFPMIKYILSWCDEMMNSFFRKTFLQKKQTRNKRVEDAESFYKNGFTLQPNQSQAIYVLHYPDCTFQTSYATVMFEIADRTQHVGRNRLGSWQQTFRRRKVELLVGYDMSVSEFTQCVPFTPQKSSIRLLGRKIIFQLPSVFRDILSFCLPRSTDAIKATLLGAMFTLLLIALLVDLIFTVDISAIRISCPSWKPTCRCLARADPTSSDLVSIGKEQTKHVLLSRFKKEGVLPSHCVHSDGSFSREKAGSIGSGTHSEAIFDRLIVFNESKTSEDSKNKVLGLLPCGLGWSTAVRRGVGFPSLPKIDESHNDAEFSFLTRTRELYLTKQQELKASKKIACSVEIACVIPFTSTSTKIQHVPPNDGHSSVAGTIEKAVIAPQPQDKEMGHKFNEMFLSANNGKDNFANKILQQSKPSSVISGSSDVASKRTIKTNLMHEANNSEFGELKDKQISCTRLVSTIVQRVPMRKFGDAQGKQVQRNELKYAKYDHFNRTETSKYCLERDDSRQMQGNSDAIQKSLPEMPSVDSAPSTYSLKVKQDDKSLKEHVTSSPQSTPSSKDLLLTRTKTPQARSAANGGICGVPLKENQSKQKVTSKEIAPVNTYKNLFPVDKSTFKQTPSDAEFPPLSHALMSQNLNQPIQAHLTSDVRPPPGLLAPPGFFFGQPNLEGLSAHSSPSSSPLRLSSHRSPKIQLVSDYNPDMKIMNRQPLNNDLLCLIGRGDKLLESSIFQPPPNGNSPRAGSNIALSSRSFGPQSFTPTKVEPSSKIEINNCEAPDVQTLLGAGSNFNVSNFLDGILGDSTQQTPSRNEVVEKPTEVTEAIPFQANTIGVPLDPWNHCDDSMNSNPLLGSQGAINYQESPMIAGISLNSSVPSLLAEPNLLNFANAIYAEPAFTSVVTDDVGGEGDLLEPDSFYNQLLGEDF